MLMIVKFQKFRGGKRFINEYLNSIIINSGSEYPIISHIHDRIACAILPPKSVRKAGLNRKSELSWQM